MSLYTRLMKLEEPGIPVHNLTAFLYELATGNATRAQMDAGLDAPLSVSEKVELTTLIATYNPLLTVLDKLTRSKEIELVLLLAESQIPPYNTEAAVKLRLGV